MQRTGLRPGETVAAKIQGFVRPPAVWTARPAADAAVRLVVRVEEETAVGKRKRRLPGGLARLSQPRLTPHRGRP